MVIHEGIHAVVALLYGEYHSIVIHWYGPQVIFVTPVVERIPDIKWFAISGISNFATLLAGYISSGDLVILACGSYLSCAHFRDMKCVSELCIVAA